MRLDNENKYNEEQPLRHSLAEVTRNEDTIQINAQTYQVLEEIGDALDLELLQKKYDPYLDQYDYLVGDLSSGHIRLKGFYKNARRGSRDKSVNTLPDYLKEYCNPGASYFVLELTSPVHHYKNSRPFKEKRVHKTKIYKNSRAKKQIKNGHHQFVIKTRKSKNN